MNHYDNPMTRFKKDLWNLCISMNVFNNIDEDNLEKCKEIFENIVSNYQSQILQQQGENENFIKQAIITEINKQLKIFKNNSEIKKNTFDLKLQEKEKEFNSLINKDVPKTPNFNDNNQEEPLNEESLELMIKQQMEHREKVMNINNNDSNMVVGSNSFTEIDKNDENNNDKNEYNITFKNIQLSLNKIEENLKIQTNVLKQIVQSQISILEKHR
tara:strand:+ start:159 stop:803 length:645 start_codon:yes stop_codon:yes gene_type:complete